jgi:transcriptional regulator with XRE-family HTH domain
MEAGGIGARGVAAAAPRNDGSVGDGAGGGKGVKGSGEMIPVRPGELADSANGNLLGDLPGDLLDDEQSVRVNTESAEAFIREKRIGERIKYLRLKKSLGLVELGRHTGLSASFLSQLETGKVVPTLRNLARIAMVFSKDLSYFFEEEPQTLFRVHRGKDRLRLPQSGVNEPSYYFESLGYLVPDRLLDPYFAEFLPAKVGREARAHQHVGWEFLYVLSGELEVRHGSSKYYLDAGDAVYFDANTVHSYMCAGEVSANVLIVTLQHPAGLNMGNAKRTRLQGESRGGGRRK